MSMPIKKNYIRLIQILTLLIVLIVVISYNKNHKATASIPDFSVKDTAEISKLIVKKENNIIVLNKQGNLWFTSNEQKANPHLIKLALNTIAQISVKEPVSKSQRKAINNQLNESATIIEIYTSNKLNKTLFIGAPTSDSLGTYARLNDSQTPYITEVPGFYGYLSKRFPTNPKAWRTRTLIHIPSNKINTIQVNNMLAPNESFKISNENESWQLYNYQNIRAINFNHAKVISYVNEFQNKKYQSTISSNNGLIDSLNNSQPIFTFSIETMGGKEQRFSTFRKKSEKQNNFFGSELSYDQELFYLVHNSSEVYLASYFEFKSLFRKHKSFLN